MFGPAKLPSVAGMTTWTRPRERIALPSAVTEPTEPRRAASPRHDRRPPRHYPPRLDFLDDSRMARALHQTPGPNGENTGTGPAHMSSQRRAILATGVVLLACGLLALRFPVFLGEFDRWGFQIHCGSALHNDLTQAVIADSAGTDFVDRCHTALAVRRAWTAPLAVLGVLLPGALLFRPRRGCSVLNQPRKHVVFDLALGQDRQMISAGSGTTPAPGRGRLPDRRHLRFPPTGARGRREPPAASRPPTRGS